jgi:large subunit ribosomal protein L22
VEVKAVAKYIRISPRKARQVVDLIRGKSIAEASAILKMVPNRAKETVIKVLNSAVANAEHNANMNRDNLVVAKVYVDQGPTLKRFKPRAMGRADHMLRRTSHVTVVVSEREEG